MPLARALVMEPKVLLLDEPLSALDAQIRQNLRVQIREIQQDMHITAIFVTHDQEEAMAISDRVCRDARRHHRARKVRLRSFISYPKPNLWPALSVTIMCMTRRRQKPC